VNKNITYVGKHCAAMSWSCSFVDEATFRRRLLLHLQGIKVNRVGKIILIQETENRDWGYDLTLTSYPEDGGNIFFQNIGTHL
jgi:hypothetical protein